MKTNQIIILSGILVAGIGTAIYISNKRSDAIQTSAAGVGAAVLTNFQPADITSFSINDGKNTVNVELKDGKWVVPARDGFPANLTGVNELRDNAFAMRVAAVQKVGESQLGRLKLKEPAEGVSEEERGTLISFKGAGGADMVTAIIGKRLEDSQQENMFNMTAQAPKAQYVKVKGVEGSVYQAKDGFSKLEADPKGWLDKEKFFKVEKLKSLDVTGPTPEESWKIYREAEGSSDLKLDASKPGEEFDSAKASGSGSAFASAGFDDILPAAEKDKAALDKPTHTAVIETFEGLKYTVKVGAKVPADSASGGTDSYYVSFAVEGALSETPPPYATPEPQAPVEPAAPAADATEEAKKKYEEDKKKYDADKAKFETDKKTWEDGKKAHEDSFKNGLVARKDKLAVEQALQGRIFVMQKYTLDPIMKKRADLCKDKPAAPAGDTATSPASPSTPAASAATPAVSAPPAPTGKIEAVTPPIEVTIPPRESEKKEGEGKKPDAPAKSKPE
jgi:hypothetical protein